MTTGFPFPTKFDPATVALPPEPLEAQESPAEPAGAVPQAQVVLVTALVGCRGLTAGQETYVANDKETARLIERGFLRLT